MSRPRKLTPSYVSHKQSGQGRLVWTDTLGRRREKLLPGQFGSPESLAAKARLELQLGTSPIRTRCADPEGISINELLLAYLEHAKRHYRNPDGTPTGETHHIKTVIRHVRELHGETPAAAFGPLALKGVRQKFVVAGWCRRSVNQQIERVRRIFKWGRVKN